MSINECGDFLILQKKNTNSFMQRFYILITANIILTLVHQISLPLFIASMEEESDIYFAILWYNFICTLIIWLVVIFKQVNGLIKPEMYNHIKQNQKNLVLFGILYGITETLSWYSSA